MQKLMADIFLFKLLIILFDFNRLYLFERKFFWNDIIFFGFRNAVMFPIKTNNFRERLKF